jgi:hypothetical protein
MRAKAQGHSSTPRAKKAYQALTHLTNKFPASTRMDADHRRIGRKTSDLHRQKMRTGHMILEKTEAKLEAATQIEVLVGG